MFDVYSVIGGMIGGTLLLLSSGVIKHLRQRQDAKRAHQKWKDQQDRLKDRNKFRERNRVGIKKK